jgi:Spy/CpxP family protein refolding chaperone
MGGRLVARVVVVSMLLATVAGPSLVDAQQRPRKPKIRTLQQRMLGQQMWWHDESAAAAIGLTNEQLERLDEMADRGRAAARPARQRYFQAYRALVEALSRDEVNEESVAKLRLEVTEAWSELISVGMDQLVEMRKILTEDQWAMLPQEAPRALRLGNVTLRGTGVATPEDEPDEGG